MPEPEPGSTGVKQDPLSRSFNQHSSEGEERESVDSLDNLIRSELVIQEKKKVLSDIPSKWLGSIRNNGNTIALYDRSQTARNQVYKYKQNKQETILVYSIVLGKTQFEPVLFELDMRKLLNDNEVLNFGFDDFNDNFSHISVQAKNLNLYIVDFTCKQVINRISTLNSINMRSIFYNPQLREKNLPMFEFFKEFIETEEQLGNRVLVPKLGQEFLAVQQGDSNLIKIFSLSQKTFVRQINLEVQEMDYTNQILRTEQETLGNMADEYTLQNRLHLLNERRHHKNTVMQQKETDPEYHLVFKYLKPYVPKGKRNLERYVEQILEYDRGIIQAQYSKNKEKRNKIKENKERELSKIRFIDISPSGSLIVAKIKDVLFIRVIKPNFFISELASINQYSSEQSIMFMPIYLDEDHNYHVNRRFYDQQRILKNTTLDDLRLSTIGKDEEQSKMPSHLLCSQEKLPTELQASHVERACSIFASLHKMQGTLSTKNQKLYEIYKIINSVLRKPRLLFSCKFKPMTRSKRISQVLEILRQFHTIEPLTIKCEHINDFHSLLSYNNFNFIRSSEKIESFTSCSDPKKFYCAILGNRKLQVYDYIQNKLMFQVKTPNASAFNSRQNLYFLDDDNLILFQDGKFSLTLINVNGQIDSYKQKDQTQERHIQTIKIEGPIRIENDFNADIRQMEKEEANSEAESEIVNNSSQSKKQVETKFAIERVFANRSTSSMASFAVTSKTRFSIYNCYDDQLGNVELSLLWDFDFQFDKALCTVGPIIYMDFDFENINVVMSTQMGWVCIMNQQTKTLDQKFQIKVGTTKKPDVITYINADRRDKSLLCFSKSTGTLYLCQMSERAEAVSNQFREAKKEQLRKWIQQIEDNFLFKRIKKFQIKEQQEKLARYKRELAQQDTYRPEVKMVPYFKSSPVFSFTQAEWLKFGDLFKISTNPNHDHVLFFTMSKGYLLVMTPTMEGKYQIELTYGPINGNVEQPLFLDDLCTHLAFIDSTKKELKYILIEYEYSFKRLKDMVSYKTQDLDSLEQNEVIEQPKAILTGIQKKITERFKIITNNNLLEKLDRLSTPTKSTEREVEVQTSKVCSIF